MRFTEEHLKKFDEQGFVIIENFFTQEETEAAREGYYRLYTPRWEDYVAAGKQNTTPKQQFFPWDSTGLNWLGTHPDIIDAAERIMGTREVRLCECEVNVRYPGMEFPIKFHRDFGNNTLGPGLDNDRGNITFIVALEEITEHHAPTLVVPTGKPFEEAVKMIVPAGSICAYMTNSTWHSACSMTGTEGCRANMWTIYSRKDQPWNGGKTFTYKSGAIANGYGSARDFIKFISEATPRQLELIGFPPVNDPTWTDEFLNGMIERYPDFDPSPYRAAR